MQQGGALVIPHLEDAFSYFSDIFGRPRQAGACRPAAGADEPIGSTTPVRRTTPAQDERRSDLRGAGRRGADRASGPAYISLVSQRRMSDI